MTQVEFGFHIAYCQKAKVSDFAKSSRQNVLHKPSDKLTYLQSHGLTCSSNFVIFVVESNFTIFVIYNSMVANSHTVRIIPQISEKIIGRRNRFLSLDYPFFCIAFCFKLLKIGSVLGYFQLCVMNSLLQ